MFEDQIGIVVADAVSRHTSSASNVVLRAPLRSIQIGYAPHIALSKSEALGFRLKRINLLRQSTGFWSTVIEHSFSNAGHNPPLLETKRRI